MRGLVLTHNAKGARFDVVDVKRWVRLNRVVFNAEKVDIFLVRPCREDLLRILFDLAPVLDVKLSLRTDCSVPPEDFVKNTSFSGIGEMGFFDVFLSPRSLEESHVKQWFEACRDAGLPVRLQLQGPFGEGFDAEAAAQRIADAGPVAVNVALYDPFLDLPPCRDAAHSRKIIEQLNALVTALSTRGLEANLLRLPLCLVSDQNLAHAVNKQQFYLDHQQYMRIAYELAAAVFTRRPTAGAKAVQMHLGRNTSPFAYVDSRLLPWITESPLLHMYLLAWRKLTRRLRVISGKPKPLEESAQAYEREVARARKKTDKQLGPLCSRCSLWRICDNETKEFKRAFPGVSVSPVEGDTVVSPMHFAGRQPKYYDAVDAGRVASSEDYAALAREANDIATNSPATREVGSYDYEIEGQWTHHMPGANRWYSYTNTEKLSTILTRTAPPLTLSVTFGGGIAEYIGFSFGRHCKLLCPMEAYSHNIVLHVDAQGRFALLRDGLPVRPVEFEDAHYVPARLGGVLEPRISIWNIDGAIITQTVFLWEGATSFAADVSRVKYSVLFVCTGFSRRLQAALLSIAHQEGIDLEKIEVVVCYVPGIDATDDIIDSMGLTHPQLRIVRSPFPAQRTKSKGFMINESVRFASGEWLVLLDADTLVAPNMFAKMEEVADTCSFIASDGRKMLTPETTAKILLGEIEPWRQWDELLEGEGEFRLREADGVPIGFCQCVKKSCMEKVSYHEMDHFEGADWFFGYDMRKAFGQETRLSGVPVLHLDHGGSQWYGTQKQR